MKKALLFILLLANVFSVSAITDIENYRWRNADGNEKTSTWKGAIDTPFKISKPNLRDIGDFYHNPMVIGLRINIVTATTIDIVPTLQYSKDNGVTWIEITYDSTGKDFGLTNSPSQYASKIVDCNSGNCTLTGYTTQQISSGNSFVPGRIIDSDGAYYTIAPLKLNAGQTTEMEYWIYATNNVESAQTYVFKGGNNYNLKSLPTLITGDCYTTLPSAPTANAEQTFCYGTNPTIANLAASGTTIVWYDAASAGNELPTTTALVDGTVYYCQQFSYCTVGVPRTAVTARIPDNSVTTNASICQGEIYTWQANGITYSQSTNYSYIKDCHTENLNLTVNSLPIPNAIANQIYNNNQVTNPIAANKICATAAEDQDLQLTAPAGFVFTAIPFASFGTPNGICDNFTLGSCHATNSVATVAGLAIGKNSVTIPASNTIFGDPCGGTLKKLYVEATYGTVRWTNDTPSIGLPASGTGTLPSFTAVNSSCSPVIATITTIFNNGTCDSTPQTFTITINPNTIQTTTTTVCDSYTWPANGTIYTTTGTYSVGTNCNTQILNLTVNKTAPPTGIANQISTAAITLADLLVTGSNIKWYDAAAVGNELPNSTIATENTSYYATQTLLGCESTIRQAFTTHKISEATQTVCLNATVNDLMSKPSVGKTVKWYNTTSEGSASLTGTTTLSSGTYYVQQNEPISPIVSTFVGSGSQGNESATGILASFNLVSYLVVDRAGNLFAADRGNNNIKKITPAGVVTIFAGFILGFADGIGTEAKFNAPSGIAIDSFDNLYVTDSNNHKIRKITPQGVVSTLAGSTQGDADGIGTAAQFYSPKGIAVDGVGNLFIADLLNYKIKKISPDGMVSTFAGTGVPGNTNGIGTIAQFNAPVGIAVDATGTLYVTDTRNGQIRKISPTGIVSTLAGNGVVGFADGLGTAAQFNYPGAITLDAFGNLYVADQLNYKIRKIAPAGEVSTFAGLSGYGTSEGPAATAQFITTSGMAIDDAGNIYVSDYHKIRKITQNVQSNRIAVTVAVGVAVPTASAQSLCGTATIADLVATGTALQWYAESSGGNALAPTTALSTKTYYVTSSVVGCESARIPVSVTITPSSDNVTTVSACDSYTWNGTTYTTSGIKTGSTSNCVTQKLDLTITPSSDNVTTVSACDSYTWNGTTYTTSGIKTGSTSNCVTQKLDLTITPNPINTVSQNTLTNGSTSLSADQMGASYVWIDCNNSNTPITGEINQSFTPTATGTYSVIITLGTCTVTSNCIVISNLKSDSFEMENLNYYPNPIDDILNLSFSKEITSVKVVNMIGQTLIEKSINATSAQIKMADFPIGIYFVEVKSLGRSKIIKVIKK